jgi:PAS domain S-box-containing protein
MTLAHTAADWETRREGPFAVGRSGRTPGRADAAIRARVLVVDDDDDARVALERLLRADGFATSTAPDGETAIAEASRARPHVVLTDLQMHPLDGVELCRRLHEIDRDLPVIVMTAHSDMQSVIESLRVGAEDYLLKPLEYDAVRWCVERAVARRTEKLEAERQRAQIGALLGNLSEGVVIADASGTILMINDAARAILGVGDEDLRTLDALDSLAVHDLRGRPLCSAERPLVRALRGEPYVDYEVVLRMKSNGEPRRVVSTGTSTRDAGGNVSLAIVLFRDVTDLRRLEQQRDEYVELISHDLRNPLSSTLMFLSTLKRAVKKTGKAEDMQLAERAERNLWRMNAMLDEITQAASLESESVALRPVTCDLREIVDRVVDPMDDARARRITIETDEASPYLVCGDASQLERVVANLITNALKYSADEAPVSVWLARTGSNVGLCVIDRGIGIAPESLATLFDRYHRTTAGKAHASGLGLGLYIARQIVEAHHGQIQVFSEVGKGSMFRLTLPADTRTG